MAFSSPSEPGPSRLPHLMSSPLASSSSSSALNASCRGGARLAGVLPATNHQRALPRHMLKPGPLGLGKETTLDGSNSLSGLRKQQFRQKCQDAMARDRKLDRGRRIAQSRERRKSIVGTDSDDDINEDAQSKKTILHSDDLTSSDVDEETREEREMEIARRVLTVDYRRMKREQERSGQLEVGWLDPDQVAWLEDEIKREEAQLLTQQDIPFDMLDEDEQLFAQYQHAHERVDDHDSGSEDDFSWLNEEDWHRALEGAEKTALPLQRITTDDVIMSDD